MQEGEILVLDYEPHWNVPAKDQVQWCLVFLKRIEEKLNYKPMIYLNLNQNRIMDWSPVVANNNGLWLAAYLNNPDLDNPPATDWPFVAMWQYTSSGNLQGYSGRLDMNVFYGNVDQFKKYGYGNPTPAPTPTPEPEPVPQPEPTPTPVPETIPYHVVWGDTMGGLVVKIYGQNPDWAGYHQGTGNVVELQKKYTELNPQYGGRLLANTDVLLPKNL